MPTMGISSYFLIQAIFYVAGIKASAQKCKTQDYKETFHNKALRNHTFKTEWASSDAHCESKCFMDNRCISYNFGLNPKTKLQNMCELSHSDHVMHPNDLIGQDSTVYRRAENDCKCPSFQVCRVNWLERTHHCECRPGFSGDRCEIEVSAVIPTTSPSSQQYTVIGSGYDTWNNANDFCKKKNGNLPSIHNEEDNLKVLQKLYPLGDPMPFMWIGIGKAASGAYSWSDGTPVDYHNWNLPLSDGYCGAMKSNGKWILWTCGGSPGASFCPPQCLPAHSQHWVPACTYELWI